MPFPFTMSSDVISPGVHRLFLCPLRVIDMCDLLGQYQALVLFDVDTSVYDVERGVVLTLDEVAEHEGISRCTVDTNTLVVTADALRALLVSMPHYNLHAFDQPAGYTELDVIGGVLALSDFDYRRQQPPLPAVTGARTTLDSHDDCYLHLDSYDLPLLKAIFSRALQIYAGTVLAEEIALEADVAEVPEAITDSVWPSGYGLTMLRAETIVTGSRVRIGVATKEFDFQSDQPYPTAFVVEYDFESREWSVLDQQ
jgi:hypothetical protein